MSMASPIFVIGNPRSGTTLLRLMLTCHRNIVVPPECGFAVWWSHKYTRYKKEDWSSESLLSGCLSDILSSRKIEYWRLGRRELFDFICNSRPESYSDLVGKVYEFYAIVIGKPGARWGDKNNFYISHILDIYKMFPNAIFIHIIRDVRDVVCSYKGLKSLNLNERYAPRLPVEVEDIVQQWRNNILGIRSAFDVFGWRNVMEIAFEDLVTDTDCVLKKVCDFLDEDFDAEMLNYSDINKITSLEPVDFIKWKSKVSEAPRKQEVGRYHSELTPSEILEAESNAKDILSIYGYDV